MTVPSDPDPRGPARPDSAPDPQHVVRRPRRQKAPANFRRRRVLVGALSLVAVVALVLAGYGWWTYQKVDRVDVNLAEVAHGEPQNYLVVGSDSREDVSSDDPDAAAFLGKDAPHGQRSDSIAVLRVDPDEDRIDVLSIPRDLWLILPDGSEDRINAAYAESTQTLIDTIEDNLGIPIHHFAEVNFVGFQKLIDALGGVPMYFDAPVRDRNSGLSVESPGCKVLNGTQGLAFARSRHLQWKDAKGWHSDPTGDLGRMTRQQVLMRASLEKANSMGLNSLPRLKGLVDAALDSTKVDSGLGFGEILALGRRFSNFDPQRLQTHSLVVDGERKDGKAIVRLDEQGSYLTLAFFAGTQPGAAVTTTTTPLPTPEDVNVSLFNGSGENGEARRVSYALTDGGFSIGFLDTAAHEHDHTTVAHAPGADAMGELVASWFGPSPEVEEDKSLGSGQVVVTLGHDFHTISEPAADSGSGDVTQDEPNDDDSNSDGNGVGRNSGEVAGGPAESDAAGSSASTTTTTTTPGWTPGVAPKGVKCE